MLLTDKQDFGGEEMSQGVTHADGWPDEFYGYGDAAWLQEHGLIEVNGEKECGVDNLIAVHPSYKARSKVVEAERDHLIKLFAVMREYTLLLAQYHPDAIDLDSWLESIFSVPAFRESEAHPERVKHIRMITGLPATDEAQ
jgi:hypothetical protein